MEPSAFKDFFVASVGASAALIGLLFVAIAVEPGQIVGEESKAESRVVATSAFTAFVNVFFVSMVGTWPTGTGALGWSGIAVATGLGLSNTLGAGLHLWREQEGRERAFSRAALVAGLCFVYVLEIWFSYQLVEEPDSITRLSNLAGLMLGLYAIGLGRAWELLGAQDQGFLHVLFPRDDGKKARKPRETPEDASRRQREDGAEDPRGDG